MRTILPYVAMLLLGVILIFLFLWVISLASCYRQSKDWTIQGCVATVDK